MDEIKKSKRNYGRTRKVDVLTGVDYATVGRFSKTLLTIEGKDIEGKTFRDFQEYVGSKITPGKFFYNIVWKDKKRDPYRGNSQTLIFDNKGVEQHDDSKFLEAIARIENKLSQKSDIGSGQLLEYSKQMYELRIEDLKARNDELKKECNECYTQIEQLENDCDELENEITELKGKTGYHQYIEQGLELLKMKFGTVKPVSLESSSTTDIPDSLLEVIGIVDFARVDPNELQKIVTAMQQYIQFLKLPLKGQ